MTLDSFNHRICPGLPADWINAWLAAVGATVLVPGLRLFWTTDALPVAVFEHKNKDPVAGLIKAWPSRERLDTMPLARNHPGCQLTIERQVPVQAFVERVRVTGQARDTWTLTSSMTDLAVENGKVTHGLFDPAGPGTIKWLHHRLVKTYSHVTDPTMRIPATLDGVAEPIADNGLGFDIARLRDGKKFVDPVVETLAFFGLALFPVRGDGIDSRYQQSRQRGWQIGGSRGFKWPAWSQPLDRHGIDALLDTWHSSWRYRKSRNSDKYEWKPNRAIWKRLGVHAAWQSTRYTPASRSETNRGYGSRRLDLR